MGETILISFQGREREVPRGSTLEDLARADGVERAESVVVFHNDAAIPAPKREGIILREGDTVEFFRFMGGG